MSSKEISKGLWLNTCTRCGYVWPSKKESLETCANPKCRSPYWNKERKKK